MRHRNTRETFWGRVATGAAEECWNWIGASRINCGYGKFSYRGKVITTHRMAYIFTYGEIPDGACVCHRCDNPKCCNPAHLWLGTQLDNMHDMIAKGRHITAGRTHCPNGHEMSKENTLLSARRGRECRTCYRAKERKRDKERRDRNRKALPFFSALMRAVS